MILGIIPSRYGSSRFPGKPLADILGKTMIRRVYEQAKKSQALSRVIVATDDKRIFDHVKEFDGEVVMTSPVHASGTDRCWEALSQLNEPCDYIINIQGDEPLIDAEQIDELASVLDGKTQLATPVIPVTGNDFIFDESSVKVVLNDKMEALYFSRSPVPFVRDHNKENWHTHHVFYRHAGMYAYRADILEKITRLPVSPLEKAESLEQLRWLEHGFKIKCIITKYESLAVDRPEDVELIVNRLKHQ